MLRQKLIRSIGRHLTVHQRTVQYITVFPVDADRGVEFADDVIGKAIIGGMCTSRESGGINSVRIDSIYLLMSSISW
jgi:hypothetical protein